MPASRSASKNGPALPSMIGGSGPLMLDLQVVHPQRRHRRQDVLHGVQCPGAVSELRPPLAQYRSPDRAPA